MKPHPKFTAQGLSRRIAAYFIHISGEYHLEEKTADNKKAAATKIWDREPEPATISGLARFLGFSSRQAFNNYAESGKFAHLLKTAILRVEHEYEKKLHLQATGIMFALKHLGWGEKNDDKKTTDNTSKAFDVNVFETGPSLASAEKDVVLDNKSEKELL